MKFTFALVLAFVTISANALTLKTTSFDPKKPLPNKFVFNGMGCSGDNISPELEWDKVPQGTKSFVVTVYDPDAPTGSGWWHWTVVNIPVNITKLSEGASNDKNLPRGTVEGRTDFGTSGWGGACPPVGDKPHRYIFTVYALKTEKLDLNENSPAAQVGFNANFNVIEKASFTVKYGR